jgi:hypothetical protein
MKIAQLLLGIGVVLTNEERQFVDKHQTHVSINSLSEHEQWIAQNLVRKGIYSISNDSRSIIKKLDETINRRYLHQDTAT